MVDEVCTESELMSSACPTDIIGRLQNIARDDALAAHAAKDAEISANRHQGNISRRKRSIQAKVLLGRRQVCSPAPVDPGTIEIGVKTVQRTLTQRVRVTQHDRL